MAKVMTTKHLRQLRDDVFVSIMEFIDEYAEQSGDIGAVERFGIAIEVAIGIIQHTSVNILMSADDTATPDEVRECINSMTDYVNESVHLPDAWETLKKIRLMAVTQPALYDEYE